MIELAAVNLSHFPKDKACSHALYEIGQMTEVLGAVPGVHVLRQPIPTTHPGTLVLVTVGVETSAGLRSLTLERNNTHWIIVRSNIAGEEYVDQVNHVIHHLWTTDSMGDSIGFTKVDELWNFIRAWVLMTVRAQPPHALDC